MATKRYNMPDLTEAVQLPTQQLPPTRQAVPPQTAFQGLVQGLLTAQRNQYNQARAAEEASRDVAIRMLSELPDSPHNTPLKLSAIAQILDTKPGQKAWWKDLVNPTPDAQYKAQMMAKVLTLMPKEGQSGPQPGKVDLTAATNGTYSSGSPVYDEDGNQLIPVINRSTGEIEMVKTGKFKTASQVTAEIKNQNSGQGLTPQDKGILTRAKILAAQGGANWETLPKEEQDKFLLSARQTAGTVQEAKDQATIITPQLRKSQIAANLGTLPARIADPSTGLTGAQEVARTDKRLEAAQEVKKTFNAAKADYLKQWELKKAIESNPDYIDKRTGKIDPTALYGSDKTKYDQINARIVELESQLNSAGATIEQDYPDLYDVKRNKFNLPEELNLKASTRTPPPTRGAREAARTKAGLVPKVNLDSIPELKNLDMPGGKAEFYVNESLPMKIPVMRHPDFAASDGVYVLDATQFDVNPEQYVVGNIVQLPGVSGNFEVVFNAGMRIVVKKQ